jgi:hypothetical protein
VVADTHGREIDLGDGSPSPNDEGAPTRAIESETRLNKAEDAARRATPDHLLSRRDAIEDHRACHPASVDEEQPRRAEGVTARQALRREQERKAERATGSPNRPRRDGERPPLEQRPPGRIDYGERKFPRAPPFLDDGEHAPGRWPGDCDDEAATAPFPKIADVLESLEIDEAEPRAEATENQSRAIRRVAPRVAVHSKLESGARERPEVARIDPDELAAPRRPGHVRPPGNADERRPPGIAAARRRGLLCSFGPDRASSLLCRCRRARRADDKNADDACAEDELV